jgi:hypothetical protein
MVFVDFSMFFYALDFCASKYKFPFGNLSALQTGFRQASYHKKPFVKMLRMEQFQLLFQYYGDPRTVANQKP